MSTDPNPLSFSPRSIGFVTFSDVSQAPKPNLSMPSSALGYSVFEPQLQRLHALESAENQSE